MTFTEFRDMAKRRNLDAVRCSPTHWQIVGGNFLVNYYPEAKKGPTYYVAGTVKGVRGGPAQAVEAAINRPKISSSRDKRRAGTRHKVKAKMLKRDARCHWCKTSLTRDTATIDHVIPIARGGLDNANNIVLACAECNTARGHAMPEVLERVAK